MWTPGNYAGGLSLGVGHTVLSPKVPLSTAVAHFMPATEVAASVCCGMHVIGSILQSSRMQYKCKLLLFGILTQY